MKLENYFRRFGIRNGSGAESSVSAVHLHYRRSADRLRPEHHRPARPADADPESVQHSRLPCNPGHSRAVCGAYDCDEV